MILDDYLGHAANSKKLAQIAIKERRFDDAWKHLNHQKDYYLKHASRMGFSKTETLVIDSSPHEDMANVLRLEGKHKNALSSISYTYMAAYTANRPIITLEKKLEAYYNRAYKKQPFKKFLSLLKALPNSDYISVRDLVEIYFPLSPNDDEVAPKERNLSEQEIKKVNDNFLKQRSTARSKEHIGIPPPLSNKPVKAVKPSYPEPKYPTKVIEPQNDNNLILGYPASEWIIGLMVGVALLIGLIWLLS
ncbi:hypothetical protein [Acinetobacter baumannii]|uniref:hypothetical protein n=1 Tax=Acinetobacter baumannii TaxID=470 RepID=UPI0020257DF0|nr:hypothetical protein [Acinetobacter baumannii]